MGMWWSTTGWLILILLILLAIWFWKQTRAHKVFDKMGLKGPKPKPLLGSMDVLFKKGYLQSFKDWDREYGKIYGLFRAQSPCIVIADPELLRDVFVKKFQCFPNRRELKAIDYKPWNEMLVFLKDDHWKHVRDTLSPIFSSGKIKKMTPVIQRCCRNLVTKVTELAESGEEVDFKVLARAFTMDVISGTAFGMEVNSLLNPGDPFVKVTTRILYPPTWVAAILLAVPSLTPVLRYVGISFAPADAVNYMLNVINCALKDRRQDTQKYGDMLQLMVDAEREGSQAAAAVDPEIDHREDLQRSSTWTRKGLTEGELQANSLSFLLGGFDTTASAMSFLLFNLAANPLCLERVLREIDDNLGSREVDYEVTSQLTYLDMCLNESLRLYPPGFLLDRKCTQDTVVGNVHVPKDFVVTIPVYTIHTDPEHWPDPYKFDPERHTPEARAKRHPYTFMPFGLGPRNCIGMRLAQVELKMAIASILQKYVPVLCSKSVYPPRIAKYYRLGAEDGFWVQFKSRH